MDEWSTEMDNEAYGALENSRFAAMFCKNFKFLNLRSHVKSPSIFEVVFKEIPTFSQDYHHLYKNKTTTCTTVTLKFRMTHQEAMFERKASYDIEMAKIKGEIEVKKMQIEAGMMADRSLKD